MGTEAYNWQDTLLSTILKAEQYGHCTCRRGQVIKILTVTNIYGAKSGHLKK